jgi:zinc D-Ala-D-Ala carboxypeptidase
MRKKIIVILVITLLAVAGYLFIYKKDKNVGNEQKPTENTQQDSAATVDAVKASKYTIDNQSSIYYVVNKKRPLPSNFVPGNLVFIGGERLRSDVADSLNKLLAAAKKEGINLHLLSGYRSYSYQERVYNGYVKTDGQAKADTYSARPGHSEHQTGLAVDLGSGTCNLQACFGETKGGKWLNEHAHEFGFIIRYQKGKENITGYQYEPWHIRYVGADLASELYQSGQTMERFFGLPAAANY